MKTSIRSLVVAAVLLVATPVLAQDTSPPQVAQAADAMKPRVDVLLSGIERVPTPDDWAALGDGAVPVLIAVMNDGDTKIVTRGRAAIGLSHFATAESAAALRALLADAATPGLLVRKGIVALTKIEGERALPVLTPHLAHTSRRVREQAIAAIGEIRTEQAQEVLGSRHREETSRYLRDLIAIELAKPVRGSEQTATATRVGER